jgi:hypothetical protein
MCFSAYVSNNQGTDRPAIPTIVGLIAGHLISAVYAIRVSNVHDIKILVLQSTEMQIERDC